MTEVQQAQPGSPGIPANVRQMMQELAGIAELDESQSDSFDIAAQVISGIAEAGSLDDIFAANEAGPVKAEDIVNVPISVTEIEFRKTAEKFRKGGLGVYVILTAYRDGAQEPMKVSCGAPNVVASMRQMQRLGLGNDEKPVRFRLTAQETPNGTLLRVGKP